MLTLNRTISFVAISALLTLVGCGGEPTSGPTGPTPADRLNSLEASKHAPPSTFYRQHNLVSDGAVQADLVDPDLVNAWGLVSSGTSPWWVSDNGTAVATLYNGNTGAKLGLTVTVPGAPTGVVFNGTTSFAVTKGSASGPARFIFASEDGTISGWNPAVAATDRRGLQRHCHRPNIGRRPSLRDELQHRHGGCVRRHVPSSPCRVRGPGPSDGICAVRDSESRRRHLRDVCAAGCRPARRCRRPRAWVRRRLRP